MKARIDELLQQIWGFNKLYIDYKEIKICFISAKTRYNLAFKDKKCVIF